MRERFIILTKFICYINNYISDTEKKKILPQTDFPSTLICHILGYLENRVLRPNLILYYEIQYQKNRGDRKEEGDREGMDPIRGGELPD